jgi:dihydroorotase-like cyclic amidohydrolase
MEIESSTDMANLLLTGGKLVNEGTVSEQDLLIKDGRIERIDSSISLLREPR